MYVSNIVISRNADGTVLEYTISIGGSEVDVEYFSGQVTLMPTEIDLEFVTELVKSKLALTFAKKAEA